MFRLLLSVAGIAFGSYRAWRERQRRRNFYALVKRRDESPTCIAFNYRRGEPVGLVHGISPKDGIGVQAVLSQ